MTSYIRAISVYVCVHAVFVFLSVYSIFGVHMHAVCAWVCGVRLCIRVDAHVCVPTYMYCVVVMYRGMYVQCMCVHSFVKQFIQCSN